MHTKIVPYKREIFPVRCVHETTVALLLSEKGFNILKHCIMLRNIASPCKNNNNKSKAYQPGPYSWVVARFNDLTFLKCSTGFLATFKKSFYIIDWGDCRGLYWWTSSRLWTQSSTDCQVAMQFKICRGWLHVVTLIAGVHLIPSPLLLATWNSTSRTRQHPLPLTTTSHFNYGS